MKRERRLLRRNRGLFSGRVRRDEMEIAVICIIGSAITSVGVTKVLATHYFKIVDGYVKEMCEKTKEFVNAFLYK